MPSGVDAKPTAIIFLDPAIFYADQDPEIEEKYYKTLAGMGKWNYYDSSSQIHVVLAKKKCFSQPAIDNFMAFIDKVQKVAQVGIVISSSWRGDYTLDDLKNEIFAGTPFADLIIDKVPDYTPDENAEWIQIVRSGRDHIDRPRSGGNRIWSWLRNNHMNPEDQRIPVKNLVIIDRIGSTVATKHPEHFVKPDSEQLFSARDMEQAYHALTELPFPTDTFPYDSAPLGEEQLLHPLPSRYSRCSIQ